MKIELAWWDLDDNDPNVDILSASLTKQILEEWENVPNLTKKFWFTSNKGSCWGAMMIWNGDKPDISVMPNNISGEIIGRVPDHRIIFDVLNEINTDN
ncbi:hypothetical protein [Xenorhabdus japonica]|uniref:Trans-2,3-dihydro-3-hydroxyanthranilate isomerase n=1 Tax=Xenorhabdus japonica TaxID=53341 RepID=A0A1I5DPJ3_9GAMM|nr:hypothetical protein [Xenorhabdus japonica]SFO01192.1 trans-2,3-dihydro-3-hydroxyanthranilate isomerase [Xenorhabdus japonica]